MLSCAEYGRRRLDGVTNDGTEIEAPSPQIDLPVGDARHVQQVVYQARHVRGLTRSHVDGTLHGVGTVAALPQHLESARHGPQGVSQFVPEQGEETLYLTASTLGSGDIY